jgi:acyl-coenzyme A thioesterase 9
MEDAGLKSLIVCTLDHKNTFNKIFGGFIMRQAFELGWANTLIFGREWPVCVSMDDIWFRKPVEVGSMLHFSSQISYTQENRIQTRVAAEVSNEAAVIFRRINPPPLPLPRGYVRSVGRNILRVKCTVGGAKSQ